MTNDRPEFENLLESLREVFGAAVTAETSEGLLRLKIGLKTAWINSSGELEGEACESLHSG
jgi:hypothetical protein